MTVTVVDFIDYNRSSRTLRYIEPVKQYISSRSPPSPSLSVSEKRSSAHCCWPLSGCTVTAGT
jgi:hypothetical protein